MKQENSKSPSKAIQREEEDRWIDVHDDDVMRAMGFFRPFNQAPRDKSVWTKTPYERRLLKELRHSDKRDMRLHSFPGKHIPVRAKLIIQLKKNKKFSKTTYSTECWQHEISSILGKYYWRNSKTGYAESLVAKYVFNGKTYGPNERPFWQ